MDESNSKGKPVEGRKSRSFLSLVRRNLVTRHAFTARNALYGTEPPLGAPYRRNQESGIRNGNEGLPGSFDSDGIHLFSPSANRKLIFSQFYPTMRI